jgi:dihydroneopterin aldolase/D-erythro-7,8-dihydroneopterin triphosphate epimerase
MPDYIVIEDLLIRAIIGINPDERVQRQDVLIDLKLETDTSRAGASDSIDDAVNYRTLTKQVIDFVEGSSFQLVEKLAEEIAALCLNDSRIRRVEVCLRKPGALRFARSVGISIERSRKDSTA